MPLMQQAPPYTPVASKGWKPDNLAIAISWHQPVPQRVVLTVNFLDKTHDILAKCQYPTHFLTLVMPRGLPEQENGSFCRLRRSASPSKLLVS